MEDLKELLKQHIDEDLLVKLTKDLVSIETHPLIPGQETAACVYIKEFFDKEGIPCYVKEVKDGRSNVVATLDSGKPGRTLIFNGHTDTVKADGMVDAFNPWIEDGKLYGRGTSDMKGPLASIMVAMKALKDTGALKEGKVIFTGVADEEQNSIGTIDIIEDGIKGDAVIVCEPTELKVNNGNRGLEWFRFHFIGKTVHGGEQAKGINAIKKAVGKRGMFNIFLTVAIVGMAILYVVSVIPSLKEQMWIVYVAQFIKSTGVIVATGYMWALVPEVISYGEYTTGKRISGIVNALTGIFFKAGMALGGVVPGLVLAYVGFNAKETVQTPFAEQGILWLVCVIPAMLLGLAMFIISRYELTDEVIDKINMEIEKRNK